MAVFLDSGNVTPSLVLGLRHDGPGGAPRLSSRLSLGRLKPRSKEIPAPGGAGNRDASQGTDSTWIFRGP